MLLAEDLLLLLTDDRSGKLAVSSTQVDIALGGAMLVELALEGRVELAGEGEAVRARRLVVRDASPTSDELLDEALAALAGKEGKRPKDVVTRLGKGLRARLHARLAARGILREERGRILGILPTHRWPAMDATHEQELRSLLAGALRAGQTDDERVAALVSLLHALKAAGKVVDPAGVGVTKSELRKNAERIAEGNWGAEAVRKAIDEMIAAVIAVTASTAAVAGNQ